MTSVPRIGLAAVGEPTLDPVVFDELRALGEGVGEYFVAELIDQFVRETDVLLAELGYAVGSGDAAAAAGIAHNVKGSCSQLGGRRLASSCGRLDRRATTGRLSRDPSELDEIETDYRELRLELIGQLSP